MFYLTKGVCEKMGTTSSHQEGSSGNVQGDGQPLALGRIGPAPGEYRSLKQQKMAIAGLIISDAFRIVAIHTTMYWIPFIALSFYKAHPSINQDLKFEAAITK